MRNQLLYRFVGLLVLACSFFTVADAQEVNEDDPVPQARLRREGVNMEDHKMGVVAEAMLDTILADTPDFSMSLTSDSLTVVGGGELLKKNFVPDPKKALWMAIVFPGGGQVYNRKYWKIPLVYGGFLGCMYAMTWNNTMYRDYSQAYIDIMDKDDNTQSYMNFIPEWYDVKGNMSRLQEMFKRKKNFYRRYRDLSMFCMIGVYALSIVDAYVDAELSDFDISSDLSMKVHPTIINDRFSAMHASGLSTNSYGLQCSFSF